ncbi:MAG: tcyL 1 [Oscillospiraceae bacterium]|nr:tcyL 1 [Oscillospiraceae bacterium]
MKGLEAFAASFPKLISVLPSTFLLFLCTVCIGITLGLVFAVVRLSRHKILNAVLRVFISFERGTPLIIQILIIYFGLRALFVQGFGVQGAVRWSPAIFALIAYSLNLASFLSETFRGAYLSIDRGQIEAAQSIGMDRQLIFRRVILPQGARIALPGMGNLLLDEFKALSLAFSIGLVEIMGRGQGLANASRGVGAVGIYAAVALVFWIVCFLLDKLFVWIEWYLSKDLRVLGTSGGKTAGK